MFHLISPENLSEGVYTVYVKNQIIQDLERFREIQRRFGESWGESEVDGCVAVAVLLHEGGFIGVETYSPVDLDGFAVVGELCS